MDWLHLLVVQGTLKSLLQAIILQVPTQTPLPEKCPWPHHHPPHQLLLFTRVYLFVLFSSLESIFQGEIFQFLKSKLLEVTLVTFLSPPIFTCQKSYWLHLRRYPKSAPFSPLLSLLTYSKPPPLSTCLLPLLTLTDLPPPRSQRNLLEASQKCHFSTSDTPQNEMQSPYLAHKAQWEPPADSQFSSTPCLSSPFFLTSLQHPPTLAIA